MVAGGLNPKDVAHATTTRPTRIVGGVNQRRWFSDALRTQADAQDFNDVIAQIRYVWDFYSIADVEGDDTLLQQAISSAALSLTGNLASFQAVTASADRIAYFTGGSSMSTFVATTYSRNLLANTNAAQWRDALGVSSIFSDNVTAFAALTSNADLLPYFTGPGTMAMATFSAFARTLIDDADAATMRATLGFGSGVPSAFFQSIVDDADAATMRGTLGLAAVAASASASDLSAGTLPSARLPDSLSSIYGLTPAADRLPYYTGASTAALATFTAYGRSLIDDVDAATARTTLGLAAIAASGSASDLSAGTLPSARLPASLSIVYGLTPAADQIAYYTSGVAGALTTLSAFGRTLIDDADAATARATLSAAAATHTHAAADIVSGTLASGLFPASLSSIYGLTPAADRLPYYTSGTTAALATFTAFARTLIDDADAATMQATLGLATIAASASASDLTTGTLASARLPASLSSIYGLTPAADRLPYYSGASTAALATFTAFGRSLVDDADAAAGRTTLALGTMATEVAANYALLAGATFTGTVVSTVLVGFALDRAVVNRDIRYRTSGLDRWGLRVNSTAEGGANAGSEFQLVAFDDAGANLGNVFTATRANQVLAFVNSPTAPTPAADDSTTKLATTAYVQTELTAYVTINAQTGTTITVAAGMYGALTTLNNASAQTCALPSDATLAVPVGTKIDFMQIGAGQCTFSAGAGATVNSRGGLLKTLQWGIVRASKRAANTWVLSGDGLSA